MPDPCDIPGVSPMCDAAGDAAGNVASAAAGNALQQAADAFAEGFANVVSTITTWWVNTPTPTLSQSAGPVGELRGHLAWIVAAVGVASLMIAMGRLAVSSDARAGREAASGLLRLVLVSGAAVPALGLLTAAGDAFSKWIINRAADGDVGVALTQLTALSPIRNLGTGVLLVVGLLGLVSGLAQLALMGIRVALLVVLAGTIPIAAAASTTERGRAALDRMLTWMLAFALYKPVAAIIYATAFWVIGSASGQPGAGSIMALAGLGMLAVAIIALPAFMKLVAPAVSQVTGSAGSGAGVIAGGAGAASLATGATRSASSAGASPGNRPPSGGSSGPGLVGPPGSQGPPGSSGTPGARAAPSPATPPAGAAASTGGGSSTGSAAGDAGKTGSAGSAPGPTGATAGGVTATTQAGSAAIRGARRASEDSAGEGQQ